MEQPIIFQRLEGAVILAIATALYFWLDLAWWVYIVLLFSFDASMLGYLINRTTGATIYNIGHSIALPGVLLGYALVWSEPTALAVSLIWIAHIGMDRALGYGLKFSSGFKDTHLGKIGKENI